jgi:hypothetical protein
MECCCERDDLVEVGAISGPGPLGKLVLYIPDGEMATNDRAAPGCPTVSFALATAKTEGRTLVRYGLGSDEMDHYVIDVREAGWSDDVRLLTSR